MGAAAGLAWRGWGRLRLAAGERSRCVTFLQALGLGLGLLLEQLPAVHRFGNGKLSCWQHGMTASAM